MYFLFVRMLLTVLDDHRKENGVLSAEDKDKISGYTAIHIHRETQHTRQNVCISLLPLNVMEIKTILTPFGFSKYAASRGKCTLL